APARVVAGMTSKKLGLAISRSEKSEIRVRLRLVAICARHYARHSRMLHARHSRMLHARHSRMLLAGIQCLCCCRRAKALDSRFRGNDEQKTWPCHIEIGKIGNPRSP